MYVWLNTVQNLISLVRSLAAKKEQYSFVFIVDPVNVDQHGTFTQYLSISELTGQQWQLTEVPCTVVSLDDSPLISAKLERPVDVEGCVTNATLPGQQEVHVILYHGVAKNTKESVELIIEDVSKSGKLYFPYLENMHCLE